MRGLQATVGMTSVIDGLIIHTWGGVEYKGPVDTCLSLSLSSWQSASDVLPLDTSPLSYELYGLNKRVTFVENRCHLPPNVIVSVMSLPERNSVCL